MKTHSVRLGLCAVLAGCSSERPYEPKLDEAVEMVLCASSEEEQRAGLSMLAEEAQFAEDGAEDIVQQIAEQTTCPTVEVPPPPPGYLLDE